MPQIESETTTQLEKFENLEKGDKILFNGRKQSWEELDHNTTPQTDLKRAKAGVDEWTETIREQYREIINSEHGRQMLDAYPIEQLENSIDSMEKAVRRIKYEHPEVKE